MQAYLVLISLAGLCFLLAKNWFRPPLVFMGFLCSYYFLGMIETENMLRGFVNPSMVTLILLLVSTLALEKTILVKRIADFLFTAKGFRSSLGKVIATSLLCSSFLNNTVVVATFLSIVRKNRHFSPSKLLLPLSYASILGGTITLIGTSTNLIVNSLAESKGYSLKLWDLAYVGVPIAIIGALYLLFLAPLMIRERVPVSGSQVNHENHYFLEAKVLFGSPLIGKTIENNKLRHLEHLFLAEIIRGKHTISPVPPEQVLQEGDLLLFSGEIAQIQELRKFPGLKVMAESHPLNSQKLVEVIVTPYSNLLGKNIREANFRSRFAAAVVGVRRAGERLSGKLGNVVLEAGDELVLATGNDFKQRENLKKNFYFSGSVQPKEWFSPVKSYFTLFLFFGAIVCSSLGLVSLFKAILFVVSAYLVTGLLKVREIRQNLRYDLFLLIGSALGISQVLVDSGATELVTKSLMAPFIFYWGGYGALIGIFFLTLIMTELITNNAAAALAFPFAYSLATELDLNLIPFVITIAYAASASFLTPFGYQTNLMVYSPGQYRIVDYWKAGFPLTILYSLMVLVGVPLFFPL